MEFLGYAGNVLTGINLILDTKENMNLSKDMSKDLADRCMQIAEDLTQIKPRFLNTGRGQKLLATTQSCLKWSLNYDAKSRFKRILFSGSYREEFERLQNRLTRNYMDLYMSMDMTEKYGREKVEVLQRTLSKSL